MARLPDAHDAIVWNLRDELSETCIANLVRELDAELATPHHQSGLLPGTLREELIERNQIIERVLTLDDLRAASRVWTINSVRGWDEVFPQP